MAANAGYPTCRQIRRVLEENGINSKLLEISNEYFILASTSSARIFGPFRDESDSGLIWANPSLVPEKHIMTWNIGGDRIWVSPEIQFYCTDRERFFETMYLSREIDPGNLSISADGGQCVLNGDMRLESHNLAIGKSKVQLDITVRPSLNPLRELRAFDQIMSGVHFCGYEHCVCLTEKENEGIQTAIWNILPVIPRGKVYMGTMTKTEYNDYFDSGFDAGQHQDLRKGIAEITGERMYKVAFISATLNGRYAYYGACREYGTFLIVKNYFNCPSWEYGDEAPKLPKKRGYSAFIYNSGDGLEKFGEIECVSETTAMSKMQIHMQFQTWLFMGNDEKLKIMIPFLTGNKL